MPSSFFRIARPVSFAGMLTLTAIVILLVTLSLPKSLTAQQSLSRISTAERADGLGHVLRFHMDSPADSFNIRQPFVDLIQLQIFKNGIDADQINIFEVLSPYNAIELREIQGGIGINIHLTDEASFLGAAYPDGHSQDLLLSLTNTPRSQLQHRAQNIQPISWTDAAEPVVEDTTHFDQQKLDEAFDAIEFDEYTSNPLKFEVVVIDAGHGGKDSGAIGYGGVYEKDITLAVALELGRLIEELLEGIKVVYTRDDDTFVELDERGRIANKAQGDLFISLHGNSNHNRAPTGAEVYILGLTHSEDALEIMKKENSVIRFEEGGDELSDELTREQLVIYELANIGNIASSEVFAGIAERQFAERARRRSRGVKQAPFMVLYHASMPAVLVELGFISNPQEKQFLTSEYGQSIMASAIFRSVREYKEMIERSQQKRQ